MFTWTATTGIRDRLYHRNLFCLLQFTECAQCISQGICCQDNTQCTSKQYSYFFVNNTHRAFKLISYGSTKIVHVIPSEWSPCDSQESNTCGGSLRCSIASGVKSHLRHSHSYETSMLSVAHFTHTLYC